MDKKHGIEDEVKPNVTTPQQKKQVRVRVYAMKHFYVGKSNLSDQKAIYSAFDENFSRTCSKMCQKYITKQWNTHYRRRVVKKLLLSKGIFKTPRRFFLMINWLLQKFKIEEIELVEKKLSEILQIKTDVLVYCCRIIMKMVRYARLFKKRPHCRDR